MTDGPGRRPPVAVVGSCIMDFCLAVPRLPRLGETVVARDLRISHGGKGANQAVSLARLGAEPLLISSVGDDEFGRSFRRVLREAGVGVDFVVAEAVAPTGIGIPLILTGSMNAIVVAPSAAMTLRREVVREARREIAAASALLLQLEVPLGPVDEAIAIAHAAGVPVFLNAAPIVDGAGAVCGGADVLVVNETEAEALCGAAVGEGVESALGVAAALRALGPEVVVVTLGERGAVFCGPQTSELVPGYRVESVDPTGAGDAFCAGLVYARVKGADWRPAVELANACGALATTRVGAMAALPDRAAAEALTQSADRWRG
jgi:ribokinase